VGVSDKSITRLAKALDIEIFQLFVPYNVNKSELNTSSSAVLLELRQKVKSNESVSAPLSSRKISDGLALGLSEAEVKEINSIPVNPIYESEYDTVLSNLSASWAYYEGGLSRVEAAILVNEHLEHGVTQNEPAVITAQTSLGEIISGGKEVEQDGVKIFTSGIPGIFSEHAVIDFYDEKAKEKYLKALERKRVLPKGGAVSSFAALETLPAASGEKKDGLNRRLTRALEQYNAIAVSTRMPRHP
jgi:hypothetical protein